MNKPISIASGWLAAVLLLAPVHALGNSGQGSGRKKPAPSKTLVPRTAGEDFFIISSVDPDKHRLVLKLPTEVTMLMGITEKTAYLDEKGKPIRFSDLRAGDTVFIEHTRDQQGQELALRIRKGEMTVAELHRRYLKLAH